MRSYLTLVVALALLPPLCRPALAHNGIKDIATTVRQLGRGGAFIATEPDVGSLAGNPAALAMLDNPQAYVDVRLLAPKLGYRGLMNAVPRNQYSIIPNIGYAAPLGNSMAWGFGIFSGPWGSFRYEDYDLSLMGAPPGVTDDSATHLRFATLTPGLAIRLSDNTAIGASFSYSSGHTDYQAYSLLADTFGFGLGELSGTGYSLRAGIYHRASPDTTLGAYWRGRSHLDVTGGTLTMGPMTDLPGAAIDDVSVEDFSFSGEYGIGIGQRLTPEWTGYAEYRRLLWDKSGDVIRFVPPVGNPVELEMAWSDQDVYVLGAEYRPDGTDDTIWRFGVNYGESCIPDSTVNALMPAITELHFTGGWEKQIGDGLSLVTAAVYAAGNEQTTTPDNTFNAWFGAGQPFSVSQESWQFGVGLTWDLGRDSQEDCCAEVEPCAAPDSCECQSDSVYSALMGH